MRTAALVWIIIFAISAAGFFIVALIVAVKGASDLKDLLRTRGERNEEPFTEENKRPIH